MTRGRTLESHHARRHAALEPRIRALLVLAGRLWISSGAIGLLLVASSAVSAAPASKSPAPAHHASHAAPYLAEEVRVRTRDGQTLAGTLTLPHSSKPLPVVLMISSAEVQTRDGGNKDGTYHPFRQIADTLSRHGIATLRLDDRGAGKSTGRLDTLTTLERANDARDALKFLRARRELSRSRVFLLGHSEGALIAAMIASQDTSVHGIVLMASTGEPGRRIIEWQQRQAIAHNGVLPSMRHRVLVEAMSAWDQRVAKDRWTAYFDRYDPDSTAHLVKVPALLLHGDADVSVPAHNADGLAAQMRAGGNGDVTVTNLTQLDHAFLNVNDFTSGVASGDAAFLLGPKVLGAILDWVVKRAS
jgi:uncharacterized protein